MRKLREGFRAIYEEGRRKHFTALPARPAYALSWPCWLCAPPVYTLNISKYVTIKKYKIYYAYCVAAGTAGNKGKKNERVRCNVFINTRRWKVGSIKFKPLSGVQIFICMCVCVGMCVWTAISWANKQRFAIFHFRLCGKGVNRKVKAVKTNEIKYSMSVCLCVGVCGCVWGGSLCVSVYSVVSRGSVHVWQLQLGLLHLLQSLPQSKVKRFLQPSPSPLRCPLYLALSLLLSVQLANELTN